MLATLKHVTLGLLKNVRVFDLVANSAWRRKRLLILCYHGISLDDEHLWRPGLYMSPEILERRLEVLKKSGYSVLPLAEALQRLRTGDLPGRSVALTFDDGTYDFYKQAYPRLKSFGFPVTVYQTTYHSDYERPIFNLICSYMLWKRRADVLPAMPELGLTEALDLRTELGRHRVVRTLIERSEREGRTGRQKDELAGQLAGLLGIDHEALAAKRILQLMNARELGEVARAGVDVQLHSHRHRTPTDESLFRREISDNRARIRALTGIEAVHFCYPSGVYRPEFLEWLRKENVISATTCDAGLATAQSDPLLLPRFVDTSRRSSTEFESWLAGVGDLLATRRNATQSYVLPPD
jgi:peptidoglycan/xylan/chitin deacetylase (PgdA/CDA1 family)